MALTVFILLLSLPVRADEAELYQNSGADTLMERCGRSTVAFAERRGRPDGSTCARRGGKAVFGAFRGLSCGVDSTGAGTPCAACIMRAVQTCAGIRSKGAFLRRFRMRGAVRRRDAAFADGFAFGAGRACDGCCCRFSACRGARVCGAAFHGGEHRDSTDLRRAVACSGKCRLGFEQRGAHPGFACVFGVFRGFCRDIV